MPLTPEDVQSRQFKPSFRGYNEEEVDAFLDEVEVELGRLLKENADLRAQLATAQSAQPVASEAEDMLRRTLLLAQRTADETVAAAQTEAQRLTSDAHTQAQATLEDARQQAANALGELDRRRQALEQHIEGLRAFEREYRTRLKAYLEAQLRDLEGRGQGVSDGGRPAPASAPATAPATAPASAPAPAAGSPGPAPAPAYGGPAGDDGEDVPRVAP